MNRDDSQLIAPAARPTSWVRAVTGLAALGYGGVAVMDLVTASTSWQNRLSQALVAGTCAVAYGAAGRWPRVAGGAVLLSIWSQLLWMTALDGGPLPGFLVFPVLAGGAGLLVGGGAALGLGIASAVAVPLAYLHALQAGGAAPRPADVTWMVVTGLCTLGAALMTRTALASWGRLLQSSEASRRRYLELFERAPEGIVEIDDRGLVVDANEAARRQLSLRAGDPVPEAFTAALAGVAGSASTRLPAVAELSRPAGGVRTYEVSAGPAGDRPGHRLLVVRDVTERRLIEERLGHAQRLETVGMLAGGVAHDFNNLLTVVGGNASYLAEHADPDVRLAATEIQEAHGRGVALTRQLLAFGRREIRQPAPLDLAAVPAGIERLLRRILGEQHRLRLETPSPVPVVADRGQLEQVVINLVTNARDALPHGGEVVVSARMLQREEAAARGSELGAPMQALLEVADEGIGMSPEVVAHIFQPFFSTKPRGKGTGLGLSTVHGVVAQHGGTVAVDTAPGRGARFRVFLPVREAAAVAPPTGPRGAWTPRGSERVLLVEDDPGLLALAERTLVGSGYHVTAAADAEAAEARAARDPFDLLLTDVRMPGADGPELARRLRARHPGLRVLFMSGYVEVDGARPTAAVVPLLQKPFAPADLLRSVRAVLDGTG